MATPCLVRRRILDRTPDHSLTRLIRLNIHTQTRTRTRSHTRTRTRDPGPSNSPSTSSPLLLPA